MYLKCEKQRDPVVYWNSQNLNLSEKRESWFIIYHSGNAALGRCVFRTWSVPLKTETWSSHPEPVRESEQTPTPSASAGGPGTREGNSCQCSFGLQWIDGERYISVHTHFVLTWRNSDSPLRIACCLSLILTTSGLSRGSGTWSELQSCRGVWQESEMQINPVSKAPSMLRQRWRRTFSQPKVRFWLLSDYSHYFKSNIFNPQISIW